MFSFPPPDRRPCAEPRSRSPPFGLEPPPKRLRDLPVDPVPFPLSDIVDYRQYDSRLARTGKSFVDSGRGSFDYGFVRNTDGLPSSLYRESLPVLEGDGSDFCSAFALGKVPLAGVSSMPAATRGFWSTDLGNRPHGIGRGMGAGAANVGQGRTLVHSMGELQKSSLGVEDSIPRTAAVTSNEQGMLIPGFPTPAGGGKTAVNVKKARKGSGETSISQEGRLGSLPSAMERPGSDGLTGSGNNGKNLLDEEKDDDLFKVKMKTDLCKHFQAGECIFNGSCVFAHSVEELNKTPGKRDHIFTRSPDIVSEQEEPAPTPVSAEGDKKVKGSGKGTGRKFDWRELQKTKICKFFVEGRCPFGLKCSFVHGNEEKKSVRPDFFDSGRWEKPPPSYKSIHSGKKGASKVKEAREGTREGTKTKFDWRKLQKTKPCKFFVEGTCPFGDKCSFLHGDEELKPAKDSAGFAESSPSEKPGPSKPSYKTRLCTLWVKGEPCEFENNCHFAHGVQELRKYGTGSSIDVPFHQVSATGDYLGSKVGAVDHFPMFSNPYETRRTNLQLFSASQEGLDGLARDFGVRNEERMWNGGIPAANGWRQSYDGPKQTSHWSSMQQLEGGYF